ncbi:tyrosine-type recombinase/integrase [Streptomyces turgidiscabies]|uniref:tyrosine-type recombinase/integrase n=1 Tax=Streptomyces turgidiscabies TaxID=85558 RepID=UPI0038F75587
MAARSPLRSQRRATAHETRADGESTRTLAAVPVSPVRSAQDVRSALISELELHLETTTNKHGRPYQRRTVNAYKYAASQLHHWMTQAGVDHDFTACDVQVLNRFFRWYYRTHDVPKSQDGKGGYTGGTSTVQRNLRALFNYLEEEYEVPNPYNDPKLRRYAAPALGKPKTLSEEFVSDCLRTTGNGSPKVRDFETVRNHAIIRVLTEGLRSEELLNLRIQDLDLQNHTLLVVPLKSQRNSQDGRPIPLQPSTVKALQRYIRVRANTHRMANPNSPDHVEWLWLGTRNRGELSYQGLRRVVKKVANQAGYDPKLVTPHSFCHTWCDDLLSAGVSGENVMAIRGWKSASMLRRYGADQASRRAIDAVHSLGDRY